MIDMIGPGSVLVAIHGFIGARSCCVVCLRELMHGTNPCALLPQLMMPQEIPVTGSDGPTSTPSLPVTSGPLMAITFSMG